MYYYLKKRTLCTGIVICEDNSYYTKTTISKDSLHTIAVTNIDHFINVIEMVKKDIIKDENGIPFLAKPSLNIMKDVSISHHGRFEKVITLLLPS